MEPTIRSGDLVTIDEDAYDNDRPVAEAPKRLVTLSCVLVALLAVMALVDAGAALADLDETRVLDRLLAGEDVPSDEVTASDDRVAITVALQSLMMLAIILVWLVWFYRAYTNVPRLSSRPLRFGKGWAIGAWFVPILNLFRPKQITNDIWRAAEYEPDPSIALHNRPVSALLHWWWALWVIDSLVTSAWVRTFLDAQTVADQRRSASLLVFMDSGSVALDVVTIAVVLAISRRYERRRSRLFASAGASGQSPSAPTAPT
jgi:hypothetical protein